MSTLNDEIVHNVLAQLDGWQGDVRGIHRTLDITDAEHADLTERVKVVADAMRLRPTLRRESGRTTIHLDPTNGDRVGPAEVTLAARIESAYRSVSGHLAATPTTPPRTARAARAMQRWRRRRTPTT
jgi:4a-hydroxytetrahydrobiopterin dehydratase